MKNFILGTVLGMAAVAGTAQAASGGMGYVGVPLGVGLGNNSYGPRFTLGAEAGYMVAPEIAIAATFDYGFSKTTSGVDSKFMMYGLEGNYYVDPAIYVGVNLGIAHSIASVTGLADQTDNNMYFGVQAGYDYEVASSFTIGAKAKYEFANTSPDKTSIVNLLVVGRYHF
ncbi:MAG: outer membrane beta-barrel protein [Bdellovibrionales bacterium]|nr:outer membrane beta-barrel protein [Bdellovibrionales bacterium]